jgi:WD40 repeat protein
VRVGLAIIFSNLILVLGLTLLSPKIFAAPNACAQVFAMHNALQPHNSLPIRLHSIDSSNTDKYLDAVLTELAQLSIAIDQAIAAGQISEAILLRAHLNERFKQAQSFSVDNIAYEEMIKKFKIANRKLTGDKTQQDQAKIYQTKAVERHLLPWGIFETLKGHKDAIRSANFSPDGLRIVTASDDGTARIWDVITGKPIATLSEANNSNPIYSANFSPDGSRIVTASKDKFARIWDSITGKLIVTLSGHTDWVMSASFSPDGSRIVTASEDKSAKIWNAITGKSIATLSGHSGTIFSANFSPNGSHIVTASHDGTAIIWDAITGESLATLSGHSGTIFSANFSPDGLRIVTASRDKTARIWDAITGKPISTLNEHSGTIFSANFSPNGSRIITASNDKTARIWDAITGKPISTLSEHSGTIFSANFRPNGSHIVTASIDGTARIWAQMDLVTGEFVETIETLTVPPLNQTLQNQSPNIVLKSRWRNLLHKLLRLKYLDWSI